MEQEQACVLHAAEGKIASGLKNFYAHFLKFYMLPKLCAIEGAKRAISLGTSQDKWKARCERLTGVMLQGLTCNMFAAACWAREAEWSRQNVALLSLNSEGMAGD